MHDTDEIELNGIAIIGMAGRFPGARNVDVFWENIKQGRETITTFDITELEIALPTGPDAPPADDYVCAKGMLDDIDLFDARFFGYLPREAEVMDPQHRIFLEICYEGLEHAGHDPARYPGAIGVFGGCYMDTYLLANLCADDAFRRHLIESIQVGTLQTELGNDKDYLATRVAHRLGLTGPAVTLQTACSTSLVAITAACQSLDSYQSDMAIAGGVTIVLPQKKGYFYKEGSMLSPDGHCRTFDEQAAGTVFSNGAAVLVLKRLQDAVADRDMIYAVIKGYAANNDGGRKVSYTAPSVQGQAEVISHALGLAEINARTIGYVEAHGTATPVGDPIEISGLTTAYRHDTEDVGYCAIGSVKANLGHLDVASGGIGTIKTALCLHESVLPPQINYDAPNPKIGIENTPFYVNTLLRHWPESVHPRRAAVSSFGVGGTNAHVILEEAPARDEHPAEVRCQILPVSAKSPSALINQVKQLHAFLTGNPEMDLADTAYTLQEGRQNYSCRTFFVARSPQACLSAMEGWLADPAVVKVTESAPGIIFLFPGQGAQYPGMGRGLYQQDPVFGDVIDSISEQCLHDGSLGADLRTYLLWSEDSKMSHAEATAAMSETGLTQPAIFAVEIAMATLLRHWGIKPDAIIGHSVGEIAGACLSGMLTLNDATALAVERGRLMASMPTGKMLAVMDSFDAIAGNLPDGVSVASENAPNGVVVSGPNEEIDAFAEYLERKGTKATPLATSHAFHSGMMDGVRQPLMTFISGLRRDPSTIPLYSTADGRLAASARMGEPEYWADQVMQPVRFQQALSHAAADHPNALFIEVGPGQALTGFARRTLTGEKKRPVFSTLANGKGTSTEYESVLALVGQLWQHDVMLGWSSMQSKHARRTALPTYPFERKRYWVDPPETPQHSAPSSHPVGAPDQSKTMAHDATMRVPAGRSQEPVETLIMQQIDLISQQLKILRNET